jgi:hypothetical protein
VADVWAPQFGGWDEGEIWRRMDAGVVDMKEGISMTRTEYSVLKEVLKYDECGWSQASISVSSVFRDVMSKTC